MSTGSHLTPSSSSSATSDALLYLLCREIAIYGRQAAANYRAGIIGDRDFTAAVHCYAWDLLRAHSASVPEEQEGTLEDAVRATRARQLFGVEDPAIASPVLAVTHLQPLGGPSDDGECPSCDCCSALMCDIGKCRDGCGCYVSEG